MQEIALHKDEFTLTIRNAMRLMKMDPENNVHVETTLNLIEKFNDDIWKCEIDGKLTNIFSNLTVDNGRLNHRGFVKVAVLVNTDFSHEILDYYMKIDEICSKLFNDIRKEQKECAKKMENNQNSYKYKLENQQMLENKIIESIKRNKDIEIENKEILIQSKNEELKLLKPLFKTIKSLTEKQVATLPSKLKHVVGQLRTNTLFKTKYDEIEDGDILFEDLPNLVYSKYSDDCVTFKKIRDLWNAKILPKKKNIGTYLELKKKFIIFKDFKNINIEIEELETNSAHNIDNNQITNVRLEEMKIEHIEYIESDEELEEDSEEESELDSLDESDDEEESLNI